jgi:CcmD family protein
MTTKRAGDMFRRWAGIAVLAAGLAATPAMAAQSAAQSAAQQPPEPPAGFVPADSLPKQEQLPAAPLVIGAYAVAWVLIFGYMWTIWQRLGRVERELGDVQKRVDAGARR